MSLVNQRALAELREVRASAIRTDSYSTGYERAIRGLNLAIGMLDQIDTVTQGMNIRMEITQ